MRRAPTEERLELLEEIEARWDEEWLHQMDKAWDALHRALTDGTLSQDGDDPLDAAVLGGVDLCESQDAFAIMKTPRQCAETARALSFISEDELKRRYFALDAADYGSLLSEDDFSYTWGWFDGLADFYKKAALADRSIIFSINQ